MSEEARLIVDSQIPPDILRPQVERDRQYESARVGFLERILWFENPQKSQRYAELFYRYTHWPLAKLKSTGHWIPVWREALG